MGIQKKAAILFVFMATMTAVPVSVEALSRLPIEFRIGLTIWLLASLPMGALIGHCVLSEKKHSRRSMPSWPAARAAPDVRTAMRAGSLGDHLKQR
jgi:hypothetical protein